MIQSVACACYTLLGCIPRVMGKAFDGEKKEGGTNITEAETQNYVHSKTKGDFFATTKIAGKFFSRYFAFHCMFAVRIWGIENSIQGKSQHNRWFGFSSNNFYNSIRTISKQPISMTSW